LNNQFFIRFLLSLLLLFVSCKRPAHRPQQKTTETNQSQTQEPTEETHSLKVTLIRVLDGDTIEVLYHELPLMIRFQHIDAPETRGDQPFGEKSTSALQRLCQGEFLIIKTEGEFDMGGRLIGEVFDDHGNNLNQELVRLGLAWHYKKYSDSKAYAKLEKQARKNHRGLWKAAEPVSPWDFR